MNIAFTEYFMVIDKNLIAYGLSDVFMLNERVFFRSS